MRVVLFGMFGVGNLGNEASLEAMLTALRARMPDAEVCAACPEPAAVARLHGVRAVPTAAVWDGTTLLARTARRLPFVRDVPSWRHALRVLRGADLFVVPGTGILDDFGTEPGGLPLGLFRWCAAARLAGARVVFASVGAGPIERKASRFLMGAAVRLAHVRTFRDPGSRAYMAGLGYRTERDTVVPDLVFGLSAPEVPSVIREPLRVGLNIMAYHGWSHDPVRGTAEHRAYLEALRRFALWLVGRGHHLRLLIGEDRDLAACQKFISLLEPDLPPGRVAPAEPAATLHDLLTQIAQVDVVVATRFHNLVAALLLSRPVLSLGYAPKNDELMTDMGLARFCQSVEAIDFPRLEKQFEALCAERGTIEQDLSVRVAARRQALRTAHDRLFGEERGPVAADSDL